MPRTKSSVINNCDTLWSYLVKLAAGERCQATGMTDIVLESHHLVMGRTAKPTRWLLDNGVAVNVITHIFLEEHPDKNEEWAVKLLGQLQYDYVRGLGRQVYPWTFQMLIEQENELKRQIDLWERASLDQDFFLKIRRATPIPK